MKKLFTIPALLLAGNMAFGTVVTDTVSTGPSYTNQVWYSLPDDEQGSSPKDNWDIAFEATGYAASILANTQKGLAVYQSPYAVAQWSAVDTAGIDSWPALHNSDLTWDEGALNSNPDGNFDLGWGEYDMNTHVVTGDSIFVVKLVSGAWKKLRINSLAGSTYTFTYANLDGSNEQTGTIAKGDYSGKNFAYYSLETNTPLDREPVSTTWDVTFTKYITTILAPAPTPYGVTGLLLNKNVTAIKAAGIDVNSVSYSTYTFQNDINTIGYDWKAFAGSWTIEDSLVYFVQRSNGDVWKLIFTGFTGSSSGSYIFSKEQVATGNTGVSNVASATVLGIYPNPTKNQFQIIFNAPTESSNYITVYDLAGRIVKHEALVGTGSLTQHGIDISSLNKGVYLVAINDNTNVQKLIVE
jgi:hypothetical protein